MDAENETEPELPQNLPKVNQGDVTCDIFKRTFPGSMSLQKHIDKCIKAKASLSAPSARRCTL